MSRATLATVLALFAVMVGADAVRAIGSPDLILAVVVIIAATRPRLEAVLLAAGSGLIEDALSAASFGHRALPLALIAWFTSVVIANVNAHSIAVRFCLVVGALVGLSLVEAGVQTAVTSNPLAVHGPGFQAFVVTALLAVIVWPLVKTTAQEKRRW